MLAEEVETQLNEPQLTYLMSSHYMPEVERLCDFVIIMSFGRVLEMSTPRQLMERHECDSLDEVFIHLSRSDGHK